MSGGNNSITKRKRVTLEFGTSQDKNNCSHRLIERQIDHTATESISLRKTCIVVTTNGRCSPSHKRGLEPHRDAPRQRDQSPCQSQSQIDTLNDSTYLCAYILTSTSSRVFAPFPAHMLVRDTSEKQRKALCAHSKHQTHTHASPHDPRCYNMFNI